MMDVVESRLGFVRERMGITETLLAAGDDVGIKQLERLTDGALAQVVIDATGNHRSMSQSLSYASFTGRIVYVGITQQEITFAHAPVMHRRELTLLASRNALPDDFKNIINLIERGQIDTRPWITHQAEFDELIEVFPTWLEPRAGVIKALVRVT
jgi:alcohol dehydrogenase